MHREDIVNAIMGKRPKDFPSRAAAVRTVNAVFDEIQDAVAAGDSVVLRGFGTFSAKNRAARVVRNVHTHEAIQVPAKRAPAFKAATAFKKKVAL